MTTEDPIVNNEAGNLRERALYAWHNRDELARQRRRERAAAVLRQMLQERLGVDVHPDAGRVTVDGLTFAVVVERGAYGLECPALNLVWICPQCGAEATGDDINDMEELGRQIEAGVPPHLHH